MSDVARMAGVSMMTVSRAYQESGRVSAAARARIAAAAAELGYVPNRAAAQLSSRRSRVIAATIPSLSEVQFGNALDGLSGALRRADYQLLIAECGPSEEEERRPWPPCSATGRTGWWRSGWSTGRPRAG